MNRKFAWLVLLLLALLPVQALADGTVYESDMILVNKVWGLPEDYVPSDLTMANVPFVNGVAETKKQMRADAALALEKMFSAALEEGVELLGVSGYRSYYTQRDIYNRRLQEMGEAHVSRYNAMPGYSEHQTGLAMDLGTPGCVDLSTRFADTPAYAWLKQHAHKYGFIIRYTEDGEEETGYAFEPWHVRYLGEEATAVYQSGLTLESYYQRKLNSISFNSFLPRLYAAGE